MRNNCIIIMFFLRIKLVTYLPDDTDELLLSDTVLSKITSYEDSLTKLGTAVLLFNYLHIVCFKQHMDLRLYK